MRSQLLIHFLALCVGSACHLSAGEPRGAAASVKVPFSVTDKYGKPLFGLNAKDIRVQDEGKPANILSLTSESEVPVRIAVVLDISGSMRECQGCKPAVLRTATMLQLLLRAGKDKAALFAYGPDTYLVRAYSDDLSSWGEAISELRPGGGSRMFDALSVVSWRISHERQQEPSARYALLLLTDGHDNASDDSREEAIASLLRNLITVYSMRIGGWGRTGEETLRHVASKSGGLLLQPQKVQDVDQALETIITDLRSGYQVEYQPLGPPSDKFRNIRITARQGTRVRSVAGYYPRTDAGSAQAPAQQPRTPVGEGRVFVPPAEMRLYLESQVPPEYPPAMVKMRATGTVVLRIVVGSDGRVIKVTPVSGRDGFVSAAVEAVRRWRYHSYLRDQLATDVETEVAVDFRIGH